MLPTVLSFSATFLPLAILVSPPTIPYSLLHQSFRHSASFSFLRLSVFLGPCFFHSLSSFHSLRRHVSPVSLPVLFLVSQLFVSEPLLSFEQPSPLLRDMIVHGKRKCCFFYESYEDRVSSRLQSADKAKVAEIRVSDISEILPLDIPLRCTLLPRDIDLSCFSLPRLASVTSVSPVDCPQSILFHLGRHRTRIAAGELTRVDDFLMRNRCDLPIQLGRSIICSRAAVHITRL